jgi:branched-chain amino acid transport system substrate-binding protein
VPAEGFNWTYGFMFDQARVTLDNIGTFELLPSNKKVGLICPNDVDGNAFAALGPPIMTQAGYEVTLSQFTPGDEDYTAHLSKFKKAGCELVSAAMVAPDFTNFWTQALQQSFQPKAVCVNRGLTFPEAAIALGDRAYNLCSDGAWTPRGPFRDSLTGMTQRQLADEYEALTGSMWSENIMMLVKFEWVADVFKRVTDIEDKGGIASAIGTTKLDCCFGPTLDFTVPVQADSYHPQLNVTVAPHAECQWVKATSGPWPLDKLIVFPLDPNLLQTEVEIQPLQYS